MSDTPRTEEAKFSGIHAHPDEEYVDADFARELERENTHLLVLATNAEFNRSKLERENARLLSNEASINDQICEMATQLSKLREAAQSVVDRWETPLWKNVEPTAAFIYRLRDSLPNVQAQR